MRVLFTGELVGVRGMTFLLESLPEIRATFTVDAVVTVADNVAVTGRHPRDGSGMTMRQRDELFDGGVDLVLTGTHVWDGGHGVSVVDHDRVVRTANIVDDALRPGKGVVTVDVGGRRLRIVQLADASAPNTRVNSAHDAWRSLAGVHPTVLHFVGTPFAAMKFAHAVDGSCAAVFGSLTHVASRDLQILRGGTAFVADIGYIGPVGGIGGFEPAHFIAADLGGAARGMPGYQLCDTPIQFSALLLDIDDAGHARELGWLTHRDGAFTLTPMEARWDLRRYR